MKKLPTLAFCALVTPVMALGASSVLAQQSGQDLDRQQQRSQQDQGATQSAPGAKHDEQHKRRAGQSDSQKGADRQHTLGQSRQESRGYMASVPSNGMHTSNLIGADVKTADGEKVGPVDDLIIDENGQVVAIVVGVGGFLGIGERDVAIGWDDVTKSGADDEMELQIDATREDLRSAPEFKMRD